MATEEQVTEMIRLAERVHSSEAFRCMDEANAGIGGTMRMLAEARKSGTVVTAGAIAEKLGVSTPRVAALLKRLESKGLIARRRSAVDARVTEVVLTEEGAARVETFRSEVRAQVAMLIDELGEERLREFFITASEIRTRLRPPTMQI
ncbi:MarR family transcriptional regulator [Collinsella sp. BA40]|uniref:MarR family winged helix-turn-helix transcriptional regulator n=1 Tax=Collinsella sp. BA40 TaxID=2560852 RepID=UPI0011CA688E|nr:MarR family transcriptional regulator [Collinsella sp. BA40]TXF37500.1 MarR family transcriptional regulator [Collinsella sp. BA40]